MKKERKMNNAYDMLFKEANEKHKGPFFYINRNKRLGKKPKMMSAKDYAKFQRTLKIAHQMSGSRAKGRKQAQ